MAWAGLCNSHEPWVHGFKGLILRFFCVILNLQKSVLWRRERRLVEGRLWRDFNFFLFGCVLVLLSISILSVYSATLNAMSVGIPLNILFPRHVINIGIGLASMVIMTLFDYRLLSGLAIPLYLGIVVLLALVLIFGQITSGAQSWLMVGTRTFQPSEFSKFLVIIVLASYLSRFEHGRDRWSVQAGGLALIGIPMLLVLFQPDLGTAMVFGFIWLVMAWDAGMRWQQLLLIVLCSLPFIAVGWQYVLSEEQKARLLTFYWLFVDPDNVDPNEGYNIIQSLNAIGAGGVFGAGLTRGLLSQGNYIPVQHSDFIFAVIGEEMGFVGGMILLVIQGLLLWLTLSIAERARDLFGRFIAIGIFGMILSHVLVNIGVTMSILPVTGIPLPFVSYGGTFTVMMLMAVGLLESIAMRWRKIVF